MYHTHAQIDVNGFQGTATRILCYVFPPEKVAKALEVPEHSLQGVSIGRSPSMPFDRLADVLV